MASLAFASLKRKFIDLAIERHRFSTKGHFVEIHAKNTMVETHIFLVISYFVTS